jgi:hypothetical protein
MLALVEEHVRGLDVPMDETLGMCRVQGVRHLAADRKPTGWLERTLRSQERPQIRSLDVTHRQVEATVHIACVVDRHHVRVLERHGELRLAGEAGVEALVEGQLGRDELQRDSPFQPQVVGSEDHAHAALTDQLLDPIAEELGSGLDLGVGAHFDLVDNDTTALAGTPRFMAPGPLGESMPALRHR